MGSGVTSLSATATLSKHEACALNMDQNQTCHVWLSLGWSKGHSKMPQITWRSPGVEMTVGGKAEAVRGLPYRSGGSTRDSAQGFVWESLSLLAELWQLVRRCVFVFQNGI